MNAGTVSIACILCGHELSWSAEATQRRIAACPGCGVPTTIPPPSRDVFSDELFFDGSYAGNRMAKRHLWLREARVRLDWIRSHVPAGRLLEIGSATGEFVATAEQAGFRAVGLESSEWAVAASRDLTGAVIRADLSEWLAEQDDAAFDVIAFFHTLEHIHDPHGFLKPLVDALANDGRMFIEVPNGGASDIRDGAAWVGAKLEDHVVHYRQQDLESLLSSVGLRCVDVQTFSTREYTTAPLWAAYRVVRLLTKGRLAVSRDFLRVVAARR
ncbi:MAG TPA: class I SAM-dependent methyltransferase [Micromonosporaceae bacterium]|nr:class I SAM-dependent methyltransferase [Micromonosporaceae bacterium]